MSTLHFMHAATLLQSGQVLITGGMGRWHMHATADLYTPATGE